MQIKKQIMLPYPAVLIILLLASVFFWFFSADAAAHARETLDFAKKGSLTLTMICDGERVPGGFLTLYRVGEIVEENGNDSFVLTDTFLQSGADLSQENWTELAKELEQYVLKQKISADVKEISEEGEVSFTDLTPGLYLVIQSKPADGYEKMSPFLVSIPMNEDGTYLYDVDASPKTEIVKKPTATTATTATTQKEPPETTITKLPQTGQLNWPVPVLALLGLLLFSLGWMLRHDKYRTRQR